MLIAYYVLTVLLTYSLNKRTVARSDTAFNVTRVSETDVGRDVVDDARLVDAATGDDVTSGDVSAACGCRWRRVNPGHVVDGRRWERRTQRSYGGVIQEGDGDQQQPEQVEITC